ncbi:MAG TPA: outer membrane protein assembly factor BamA, partial [Desulfosarcina sp.]|nr:outer membrane protein assembly factor BamA [Desulfosarcina sp.]
VSVRALPHDGSDHAEIVVDIRKGPHYQLRKLVFEGNRGIPAGMLKLRMGVWRSALLPGIGRFSDFRLERDMDNLRKYYRSKGFADARLAYRKDIAADGRHVDVAVEIQEGPLYEVSFTGNERFWDLTLKKDVAIYTDGNRSNIGVRKSVRQIRQRYREAGFLEARVKTETTVAPDAPLETRRVRFAIEEGPQTLVASVDIEGNRAIDERTIRKQILTRPPGLLHEGAFVPEVLEEDVYAVTTLYTQQGFQERRVDPQVSFDDGRTEAAVALGIDEGVRTRVRSVAINGLTAVSQSAAEAVLVLKEGEPFRRSALEADREAIAGLVSEEGFPHVAVTADVTFSDGGALADIVHSVDPGPRISMGGIFVSGNLRTDASVIHRELELQPGDPLSLRKLYDGQRNLRDLEIFHDVNYRILGLKEKADPVNLFVEIEERKPYYAQISAGYESDSGFFGRTRVGDRNLFGWNKHLWAGGEISQTGYRAETRLSEPRLLGTRTSASIGLFNQELSEFNQPFGTRTTGGSLVFGHDWGDHVTTALTFGLERRDQFKIDDRPTDQTEEEPRTILVITPYIRYDSRDSFVRPTRGLLTSLNVDISKGVQKQVDDFVRYQFDARYYYTPWEGITFAALARIGQVLPYSQDDLVPDDQLFFLGGIQDVRGFKENLLRFDGLGDPVGGKTAMVGSLEGRIDLGFNLELTAFFDVGSVQDALVDEGSDRFRPTVGMGLRYITPIGPMGLLYGHKLDRESGESAGRWHLSIGYSF